MGFCVSKYSWSLTALLRKLSQERRVQLIESIRFRDNEIGSLGDGFLVTFDGRWQGNVLSPERSRIWSRARS